MDKSPRGLWPVLVSHCGAFLGVSLGKSDEGGGMQIPQGHLGQILVAFLSDSLRESLGGDTQITCGILAL